MTGYLGRQIDEIANDRALRGYGVALLLTHVLTAFWLLDGEYAEIIAAGEEAICWPLVPECESLRFFSMAALERLIVAYGAVALVSCAAFARSGTTLLGWAAILILTLFKYAVIGLDFRLRANQHYMALAATGVFLFFPSRRESVPIVVVLFYFWAGTLKLNWEWLSGAALYKPLWLISGPAVVAACAYVIVLELVVVWGLLARRGWIFWSSLAQVALFHVMSWAVVGFFYPVLMFLLLAIFPLARLLPVDGESESFLEKLRAGRLPRPAWVVAGLFSLLQLTPHLYPGDTAITGEGRLYALHMFDARVVCQAIGTMRRADGSTERIDLQVGSTRNGCDPIRIRAHARILCRRRAAGAMDFESLDLDLRSRRATDSELTPVIQIEDFCANPPRYSPFLHNEWIIAE